MNKFWMVFNPSRNVSTPTKTHSSLVEAKTEAERLSKKHKEQVFVLECIGAFSPKEQPIEWSDAQEVVEAPVPQTIAQQTFTTQTVR